MPLMIGGGIALAGGALKGLGSMKAGNQAAKAAEDAAQAQKVMYLQTRQDLQPYNQAGQEVLPAVNALAMAGPTAGGPNYVDMAYKDYLPPRMTQAELEATPGYQFTRDQGLKAVQSSAAARGLGVSGSALKGAAAFTTGLANQTYKDQFDIAQKRFTDVTSLSPLQQAQITGQYQRLHDTAALGENAAAAVGTAGTQAGANYGNALIASGTAQAQGTKGLTDAIGNPLTDIGGAIYGKSLTGTQNA